MRPDEIISIVHRIDMLTAERNKIDKEITALKAKLSGKQVSNKNEKLSAVKPIVVSILQQNSLTTIAELAEHIYGKVDEVTRNRVRSTIGKLKAEGKIARDTDGKWIVKG